MLLLVGLETNVAKKPREQTQMQLLVASGLGVELPPLLVHDAQELGVDISPLPEPSGAQEVLSQELIELALAQSGLKHLGAWTGLSPGRKGAKWGFWVSP